MTQRRTIDVTGLHPFDVQMLEALVLRLRYNRSLRVLDTSLTQHTDGAECWCNPAVEHYEQGDVIIHRDKGGGALMLVKGEIHMTARTMDGSEVFTTFTAVGSAEMAVKLCRDLLPGAVSPWTTASGSAVDPSTIVPESVALLSADAPDV